MLVVSSVQPGAAAYYFRGQGPGRWAGAGSTELGLAGPVERADLEAVLAGRQPGTERFLPETRRARRRAGWDLVLAAPKSVSLLSALAPQVTPAVTAAHRQAVAGALRHLEGRLVHPAGAVMACFEHGVNAAGEPHLHTHVLLANLVHRPDGHWRAVAGPWWPNRQALSALYQLGLRHHLAAAGWRLAWQPRPDGLGDLAAVPRAAVDAASSRRDQAVEDRVRFDPLLREGAVGTRRSAAHRTRPVGPAAPWSARAAAAGFGPTEVAALVAAAAPRRDPSSADPADPAGPPTAGALAGWLAGRRSTFRETDVLVGLAATCPGGMSAHAAAAWADRFCEQALPVQGGRWTTVASRRADEHVVAEASRPRRGLAVVAPATLDDARTRHAGLPPAALASAERLVRDGRPVEILGAAPGRSELVSHAAVLDAARTAWQLGGYRVGLDTPSPGTAARWRALTGLQPIQPGRLVDVLVVDQADRRPTQELLGLVTRARQQAVKLVLVEGGTRGRLTWTRSAGLDDLGDQLGRLAPSPLPDWGGPPVDTAARDGVVVAPTSLVAARLLLADWFRARRTDPRARLVGLGAPEVEALNLAARRLLDREGRGPEAALDVGTRELRRGEEVVALGRIPAEPASRRRASPTMPPEPAVPGGAFGVVVEVDSHRGEARVRWPEGTTTVDRRTAATCLGYAYAVPASLASQVDGSLFVLGDVASLGRRAGQVRRAAVVAPAEPQRWLGQPPPRRTRGTARLQVRDRNEDLDLGLGLG